MLDMSLYILGLLGILMVITGGVLIRQRMGIAKVVLPYFGRVYLVEFLAKIIIFSGIFIFFITFVFWLFD